MVDTGDALVAAMGPGFGGHGGEGGFGDGCVVGASSEQGAEVFSFGRADHARVRLLDRMKDQLAGSVGGTLVMGVRPEAMSDEPTGRFASNDNVVEMTVNVVEPLGDKMDLYVSTAAHSHIVARIDAHRGVEPNTQQRFYIDMERVHLFEQGETGRNLTLSAESVAAT